MTNKLAVDGEYNSYTELTEFQEELIDKYKPQETYMYGLFDNLNDFNVKCTEDGYSVTFD